MVVGLRLVILFSCTVHGKKPSKRITRVSLPRTQPINSQSRVWRKGEECDTECFLQCANQDQKVLISPKSEGMSQPAPTALQDWWHLHSLDGAHFGSQSSWWLCLSSQPCTKALFYGPHRKLSSCISNITVWICAGWGPNSALSWRLGRWSWAQLMHLKSRKHSTKQSSHRCLCSKSWKKNVDGANPCLGF